MRFLFTNRSPFFPFVLLGTLFLKFVCSATAQDGKTSTVPPLDQLAAKDELESSSCTLDVDGTCTTTQNGSIKERDMSDQLDDSEIIAAIVLPEPDAQGFIDIGYGERQVVVGEHAEATRHRLKQIIHYMETTVQKDDGKFSKVRNDCLNRNENCAFWAAINECNLNPAYMRLTCAPSCMSCEQLAFETRCPLPEDMEAMNTWNPGDLDRMAQRILQDYPGATVLAKPNTDDPITAGGESSWLIQVDDFLTEHECDTLIELGTALGYEESQDVGERKFDGTYGSIKDVNSRTSTNAWCLDQCFENATTKVVLNKLKQLTGISDMNSEYLQLLRYDVGQFYRSHHDYIPHHLERAQGVRILTVFLYLNDVEQGGGTRFTDMDITCQPKRGRVVLWPSVTNDQPNKRDENTHHEALPVEKGVKYAANAWFHQRDFKTPYKSSCI